MPPRRSVFRRLLPLLFTLGCCGSIFADSGQDAEAPPKPSESVKTPNRVASRSRVGADDELLCAECGERRTASLQHGEDGVDEKLAHESRGVCAPKVADPNAEILFWLPAPLLADLPFEALYFGEGGERDEWAAQQMHRAVFGGEDLALFERDETAGPDLFAELHVAFHVVGGDTLGLPIPTLAAAPSVIAIESPSSIFPKRFPRVAISAAPQFSLTGPVASASQFLRIHDSATIHLASGTGATSLAREPPTTRFAQAASSLPSGAGSYLSIAAPASAAPTSTVSSGSTDPLLPIEQVKFEKVAQKNWGPTKNVLAVGNYFLFSDRSLASLKLDGVNDYGDKDREGVLLGRVITLSKHTLTLTGAGLLSTGDKRDLIEGGTLATTRDNFEIHVTGGGHGFGGLEINAILANGPSGATGLIKTGDGELIISNQQKNTLRGDVYVKRGTLTLRAKDGALPSKSIYVGDGTEPAILNLKGGRDHINTEATVTLRGSERGAAVLRFEKTHPNKGVVQTLEKLVIEGSGVIEFIDPFISDGKGTSPNKNALYIDELDLRGDLTIRGWDQYDTQIFIKRSAQTDAELLARIHVEGHANLRVTESKDGYWSLEAAPIPEPATCAAIMASGACALVIWRKRTHRIRLRGFPNSG